MIHFVIMSLMQIESLFVSLYVIYNERETFVPDTLTYHLNYIVEHSSIHIQVMIEE